MAADARMNYNDIVTAMFYDDSSSDSSSSDEDDLDFMLIECMFPQTINLDVPKINLEDLSDWQCEKMFRFQKNDMQRLLNALKIPAYYTCSQRTNATGIEALMILLRRLAYPNRWCDLVTVFGRSESELSLIFNKIVDDIHDRFNHLLQSLDLAWLNLELFSASINAKGAPLTKCWGFIDGTQRPIARPIRNQRIMYSGHKRIHCLKFQSVHAPNGLIVNLFGPIEGRRHDAFMFGESGLAEKLRRFETPNGEPYVIYGDPAYGLTYNVLAPFRGAHLTDNEREFNKQMSKVRVSMEWGFGKICQYLAFLDFKKNMKILLQPVAKYYLVGTIYDKLPHLPVWIPHKHVLRSGYPITGGMPVKSLRPN